MARWATLYLKSLLLIKGREGKGDGEGKVKKREGERRWREGEQGAREKCKT